MAERQVAELFLYKINDNYIDNHISNNETVVK